MGQIIGDDGDRFADGAPGTDNGERGQRTGAAGMQAAAAVGEAAAVLVMRLVMSGTIMRLVMQPNGARRRRSNWLGNGQRICMLRRHHARKLRRHEQADQQPD